MFVGWVLVWAVLALAGRCQSQYKETLRVSYPRGDRRSAFLKFHFDISDVFQKSEASLSAHLIPLQLRELVSLTNASSVNLKMVYGHLMFPTSSIIDDYGTEQKFRNGLDAENAPGMFLRIDHGIELDSDGQLLLWHQITRSLSGLFCNALDSLPRGVVVPRSDLHPSTATGSISASEFGFLPDDTYCSENLGPLLKILPCGHKSGFAALINGRWAAKNQFRTADLRITKSDENHSVVFNVSLDFHFLKKVEDNKSNLRFEENLTLSSFFDSSLPLFKKWKICPVAKNSTSLFINGHEMNVNEETSVTVWGESELLNKEPVVKQTSEHHMPEISRMVHPLWNTHRDATIRTRVQIQYVIQYGRADDQNNVEATTNPKKKEDVVIVARDAIPSYLRPHLSSIKIRTKETNTGIEKELPADNLSDYLILEKKGTEIEMKLKFSLRPGTLLVLEMLATKDHVRWPHYTYSQDMGYHWTGPLIQIQHGEVPRDDFMFAEGNYVLIAISNIGGFFNTLSFACVVLMMAQSATSNLVLNRKL